MQRIVIAFLLYWAVAMYPQVRVGLTALVDDFHYEQAHYAVAHR